MTINTLLVEIITEELPPTSLLLLAENFAEKALKKLTMDSLITTSSNMRVYATPRRIGFQITNVKQRAENSVKQVKLLPKKIAFNENREPTDLLKKKISSLITSPTNQQTIPTDKHFRNFILNKTRCLLK